MNVSCNNEQNWSQISRNVNKPSSPWLRKFPFHLYLLQHPKKKGKLEKKIIIIKKIYHQMSDAQWSAFTLYSLWHLWVRACQEFLLLLAFPVRNKVEWISGLSWHNAKMPPLMTPTKKKKEEEKIQHKASDQLGDCWSDGNLKPQKKNQQLSVTRPLTNLTTTVEPRPVTFNPTCTFCFSLPCV